MHNKRRKKYIESYRCIAGTHATFAPYARACKFTANMCIIADPTRWSLLNTA